MIPAVNAQVVTDSTTGNSAISKLLPLT
jgi:hypothetical protein